MNLPFYQHITIQTSAIEDITCHLKHDLNFRKPIVLNLMSLTFDEQRETIGIIENWFNTQEISMQFPYPIYFLSSQRPDVAQNPVINDINELPIFFKLSDPKTTVKESYIIDKNKLLQQEIKNTALFLNKSVIKDYADKHKYIRLLALEKRFYSSMLNELKEKKKDQDG